MFLRGSGVVLMSQLGSNQRDHRVGSLTVTGTNSAGSVALEAASLGRTLSREMALNTKTLWAGKLCQILFQEDGKVISFVFILTFFSWLWNCDHRAKCLQTAVMSLLYNVQMSQFVCRASWPSLRTNYTADHWLPHKYLHPLGTH